jgi:hypothetical protein
MGRVFPHHLLSYIKDLQYHKLACKEASTPLYRACKTTLKMGSATPQLDSLIVEESDLERRVLRSTGKDNVWVFRTPEQKWDKEIIETYKKGKDVRVMI